MKLKLLNGFDLISSHHHGVVILFLRFQSILWKFFSHRTYSVGFYKVFEHTEASEEN